MKRQVVRAPSNIALIKYMGKTDAQKNLPENASLSMTLDSLCTWVEIEASEQASGASNRNDRKIKFLPEAPRVPGRAQAKAAGKLRVPDLSKEGRAKVIRHVERVEQQVREFFPKFGIELEPNLQNITLRSANTFPEASGIASSASSFAAITLAVALVCARDEKAFQALFTAGDKQSTDFKRELAKISRQGSGSSCRSFEGPFVTWSGENTETSASKLPTLRHFVILVSESQKTVSSSEAHARVKTSPLWQGRVERVEARLQTLKTALALGDFKSVAKHTWSEAWEMHSLFHTSEVPFTYWKSGSVDVLNWLTPFVESSEHPPLVTLDAGPNVHVIVGEAQYSEWRERFVTRFGLAGFLEDRPGSGAQFA